MSANGIGKEGKGREWLLFWTRALAGLLRNLFSPHQAREALGRSRLLLAHVDWDEAVLPSAAQEHRPLVKIDS